MTNTTLFHRDGWFIGGDGRRAVRVRVMAGGHEVDGFEASSYETLRSAIRPIYAHLPLLDASVQFTGLQVESYPLGIRQSKRLFSLNSLREALRFLGAKPDVETVVGQRADAEAQTREKTAA